jgi:hypothetical protein
VISPISMRNGRYNTSKCRGKLQQMGVLYTYSPKSLDPFLKLPKNRYRCQVNSSFFMEDRPSMGSRMI